MSCHLKINRLVGCVFIDKWQTDFVREQARKFSHRSDVLMSKVNAAKKLFEAMSK